jgi:hypothetical protein
MSSPVDISSVFKPIIGPVLQIKLSHQLPLGFSVGQTVDARVLERLGDGRFVIGVGNSHFTAEAETALKPGQTMTLRVDSLSPRVLLSVASAPEERITAEYLRVFRSNPGALAENLGELEQLLRETGGAGLARFVGRDNLDAILGTLRSATLGREHLEKGFSLREVVRSLGLLLERELKEALESPGADPASSAVNLKTSLMKVLEEIQGRLQSEGLAAADRKTMKEMIPVLERAVRAIESQQVLNVHFRQTEDKVLIQIPIFLPGLTGTANIFVHGEDGNPESKGRQESFRIVFALEMDALGDVIAEALFHGKTTSCRIRCGSKSAADFIENVLPALEGQLTEAGYRVTELSARMESDVGKVMEACLREEMYGDGQTLSVFA